MFAGIDWLLGAQMSVLLCTKVVIRLDFLNDGTGGRKLVLGAEPTPEEPEIGLPSSLSTGRMSRRTDGNEEDHTHTQAVVHVL